MKAQRSKSPQIILWFNDLTWIVSCTGSQTAVPRRAASVTTRVSLERQIPDLWVSHLCYNGLWKILMYIEDWAHVELEVYAHPKLLMLTLSMQVCILLLSYYMLFNNPVILLMVLSNQGLLLIILEIFQCSLFKKSLSYLLWPKTER